MEKREKRQNIKTVIILIIFLAISIAVVLIVSFWNHKNLSTDDHLPTYQNYSDAEELSKIEAVYIEVGDETFYFPQYTKECEGLYNRETAIIYSLSYNDHGYAHIEYRVYLYNDALGMWSGKNSGGLTQYRENAKVTIVWK